MLRFRILGFLRLMGNKHRTKAGETRSDSSRTLLLLVLISPISFHIFTLNLVLASAIGLGPGMGQICNTYTPCACPVIDFHFFRGHGCRGVDLHQSCCNVRSSHTLPTVCGLGCPIIHREESLMRWAPNIPAPSCRVDEPNLHKTCCRAGGINRLKGHVTLVNHVKRARSRSQLYHHYFIIPHS